jgi:CheY-like chemotaxis protein
MDVDMPEMNGHEATERIREREKTTGVHIPIIAMTAHAMQGAREECLRHGMDGYVSKPIDTEALWRELESIGAKMPLADTQALRTSDAPRAFDLNKVLAQIDGDSALFGELTQLYLAEYPDYLAGLKQAMDEGDVEKIQHSAHTIKGVVSIFCVEALTECARKIEQGEGCRELSDYIQLSDGVVWLAEQLRSAAKT